MFDIAPSEFLLVAFVALVVIGPKDLPKAMRVVGYWVGKARGVARQFRSGFDSMVREAELEEMEKRWASENERIMREHPQTDSSTAATADTAPAVHSPETEEHRRDYRSVDHTSEPVMVEKPVVAAAVASHAASSDVPVPQGVPSDALRDNAFVPSDEHGAHTPVDHGSDLSEPSAPTRAPTSPVIHSDDKTGKSDVASS